MSCWFPAAGCTRVQASRCDAGVEKPWKPIKNPVSWPSSRLPHGGDEPPAETIRPVQAPSLARTDSSALQQPLAARYRARAAWTDSTQLDFTGGGNLMKEKSSWELLQLGVGQMRQNKQTSLYTQIYR